MFCLSKDTNTHPAVVLKSLSAVKQNEERNFNELFLGLSREPKIYHQTSFNFTKLEMSKEGLAVKIQAK